MLTCNVCGKSPLLGNERGLCLKYLGRDSTEFYCFSCLAVKLGTGEETLRHAALRFQRQGCMLFPPMTEEEKNEFDRTHGASPAYAESDAEQNRKET